MKRLSLLALLALTMAAAQTAPIPSFTLTGKVTNGPAITADSPLIWKYGKDYEIGRVDTNKNVTITLTSELMGSIGSTTLEGWKNGGSNCNSSEVTVEDARVNIITNLYYTIGADQYYLRPMTDTTNMDGSITRVRTYLIYARAAGSIKGNKICGPEVMNFDLKLQPGWNIADEVIAYNPSTKRWGTNFIKNARSATAFTGSFMTFKAN